MKKCARRCAMPIRPHHHMHQWLSMCRSPFPTVDFCAAQSFLWSASDCIGKKKNILVAWGHNFSSTRLFWSPCFKTKDNFVGVILCILYYGTKWVVCKAEPMISWAHECSVLPWGHGWQLQIVEHVTSRVASSLNFTFFLFLVQPENKNISSNTYPVIWMTSWTQWVIIFSLYCQLPI